ncbi:hypothetical protein BX666DRAFT_1064440 [Dichotomocladium elegans]|nr:hypothetical protein BX666DRAFT_1064440 [Dichotomocladium elegans]
MQQSNNSVRGFVSKLAKSPPDVPRLFVKYFKGDSSSDISSSDYLDATWENYRLLISSIFRNVNAPQISFQTLYEACSNLCCVGEGAELYNHLYDELVVYFVDMRSFLVNMASSNDNFLDYLLKSWRSTCDHIARISEVFIELDRRYALRNTSYRSIRQVRL